MQVSTPQHTLLATSLAFIALAALTTQAAEPVSFVRDIAPVLLDNCVSCHGPKKAEGGYRLDSYVQLARAGDSGESPLPSADVDKNDAALGELLRRITTDDESERMPPERAPLSAQHVALLKQWLVGGHTFDGQDRAAALFEIVPAKKYASPPDVYDLPIPITAMAWNADGSELVTGGYHELLVWNVVSGQLKRRIENMPQRITSIDWNADHSMIAVAGGSPGHIGEVRIASWPSGDVAQHVGRANDVVNAVRYQPAGSFIATGNSDGTLRWYDSANGKLVQSIAGHADYVQDIAWSHDGKRLVSASRDKTVKVFGIERADLVTTYTAHGESVIGVAFVEGDKEVTSVGLDRKLHRWQVEDGKALAKVELPAMPVRMSARGPHAWLGLNDRNWLAVELATSKLAPLRGGHTAWVTALALDPTGKQLATGSLDGRVRIVNLETNQLVTAWQACP